MQTQIFRFISLITGEAFAMDITPDIAQELITRGVVRLEDEEPATPKAKKRAAA
jgi:hypothetical protein